MNNVMYQTRILNKEIKHSNEYHQYIRTLQRLREDEGLYGRTKEFRKQNMNLQMMADYNTLEDVQRLRTEYNDILTNPVVDDFLVAEQRIVGMLKRVEDSLLEGIDLDTGIMDE